MAAIYYGFDGDYRAASAPTVATIVGAVSAGLLASAAESLVRGKPVAAAVTGGTGASSRRRRCSFALRPGGRLALVDIWATRRHLRQVRELGWTDARRRGLGWRMWWGPGMGTHLITATKRA